MRKLEPEREINEDELDLIEALESATTIEEVIASLEKFGMIVDVQDIETELSEMPGKYDTIH